MINKENARETKLFFEDLYLQRQQKIFFFFVIVMCVPSSVFCVPFLSKRVLLPPGVNTIAVK
jgi:hypothetical protein